ncbi:hypothetical protein C8F04DRAFT_1080295 [Mycena alexandri]|uniref:Uncharacterized protein n=1 Tax=Mycena alexandri TaxID=1745969 RepID=A0AAD6T9V7_9AGAR|nr:hypothetical protein C8F04DRAFT_1080295 [Mycena alexandri]
MDGIIFGGARDPGGAADKGGSDIEDRVLARLGLLRTIAGGTGNPGGAADKGGSDIEDRVLAHLGTNHCWRRGGWGRIRRQGGKRRTRPGASNVAEGSPAFHACIEGGLGGLGGGGISLGGSGGVGERPDILVQTLYVGKISEAARVNMPLKEFCTTYKVNKDLFNRLVEAGFSTVAGLLKVTTADLRDEGFSIGHIAELQRALEQFVAKNEVGKQVWKQWGGFSLS